MSKVMNQLFLGSKTEEEIELSSDPEYINWSKQFDEYFRPTEETVSEEQDTLEDRKHEPPF